LDLDHLFFHHENLITDHFVVADFGDGARRAESSDIFDELNRGSIDLDELFGNPRAASG
jgi:hypothetical protein